MAYYNKKIFARRESCTIYCTPLDAYLSTTMIMSSAVKVSSKRIKLTSMEASTPTPKYRTNIIFFF